ncbi:MAG: cytochrome-c oxidase, cbb3-type subunit I [SAR324 cluster bacterium]|nr:cytochrome-c oxidase, cbb3-type subunit I [SAR324 cluster bacterium]
MTMSSQVDYDYSIVKGFILSALLWGAVGMTVGVWIALELAFPVLNFDLPYLSFNRLRPLHTNAVIFGFTLSGVFASWYYISQRVLKVRMVLPGLAKFHLYLYNLIIVLAAVSLLMGVTSSKEYAELQWPIDILVVVMWLSWGAHIFAMAGARKEKTLYVSIWYFMASFLGVGMLYIFNNFAIPTRFYSGMGSFMHSVSAYSGTNDANVQWWYGHNAVAFVFTVPIIAMAYYFIPKQANQPIWSYKLSLWSFWGLIFLYLWAGPHHMLYSTIPDWVQTLAMLFSIVLIIPSWGSMINLMLTVSGKWEQLKTDPILKFMVIGSTFYGFATLEGSVQAIKSVNALAHFGDWIIGHVHNGALGWVAFMIMAAIMHMAPRIWNTQLYSIKLANQQFWIQTVGIVFYFSSMWVAGITQGLMWRATDQWGNLAYSFLDTVKVLYPYWSLRAFGGILFLSGFFMFAYNITKTIQSAPTAALDAQPATA